MVVTAVPAVGFGRCRRISTSPRKTSTERWMPSSTSWTSWSTAGWPWRRSSAALRMVGGAGQSTKNRAGAPGEVPAPLVEWKQVKEETRIFFSGAQEEDEVRLTLAERRRDPAGLGLALNCPFAWQTAPRTACWWTGSSSSTRSTCWCATSRSSSTCKHACVCVVGGTDGAVGSPAKTGGPGEVGEGGRAAKSVQKYSEPTSERHRAVGVVPWWGLARFFPRSPPILG